MNIYIFTPSTGYGGCDYYAYCAETVEEAREYFADEWYEYNLGLALHRRKLALENALNGNPFKDLDYALGYFVDWFEWIQPECVLPLDNIKPGKVPHEQFAYWE